MPEYHAKETIENEAIQAGVAVEEVCPLVTTLTRRKELAAGYKYYLCSKVCKRHGHRVRYVANSCTGDANRAKAIEEKAQVQGGRASVLVAAE